MKSTKAFNSISLGAIASCLVGLARAGPSGCTFSISASCGIACPAGQLSDGQIRLNGSEPTAYFTIYNGQITDTSGRGCIITDAPITQVQCDQGKAPLSGFAVAADNTLSYQGNPKFWACPATDTEYNIYVNPNFGQAKCFPIGLAASACGAPNPPPVSSSVSCPAPSAAATTTETTWQTTTCTVTDWRTITQTSAITVTSCAEPLSSLSGSSTGLPTTAPCHKCYQNSTSYSLNMTKTHMTRAYETKSSASLGWK